MKAAALAFGMALLAGCGTTVAGVHGDPAGLGGGGATPGGGLAGPAPSAVASAAPSGAGGAGASSSASSSASQDGRANASAGAGAVAPLSDAPSRAISASAAGPVGPGITATTVRVGIYTIDSSYASAAKNALGPAGDLGNLQAYYQDLAANFNATHSLGGRKLQLVIRTLPPTATDQASQDQAACTAFTQDDPVVGVITDVSSATLVSCTSKAGIPTVQTDATFDSASLQSTPYLLLPIAPTMNRYIPALVSSLSAGGFFAPSAITPTVVGVLYDDVPAYQRAYTEAMVPALRAAGVSQIVAATSAYPSNDELGASSSDISNAVLRFRSDNVDRVLFLSTSAWEPSAFMNDAAVQHYTPRYGLTSQNYPYTVSTLVADKSQLNGAVGIGWLPPADVAQADDPLADSPSRRACMAVLQKAGDGPSSTTAYTDAALACDQFDALAQGLLAPGGLGGRSGLMAAMTGGRTGFQPEATFASLLSPGRHDGAATWRSLSWGSCGCFQYSGPERSL
jgi:hypothetical protein